MLCAFCVKSEDRPLFPFQSTGPCRDSLDIRKAIHRWLAALPLLCRRLKAIAAIVNVRAPCHCDQFISLSALLVWS